MKTLGPVGRCSEVAALSGLTSTQMNLVLLGGRNSGKSSVGNYILGREEFVTKERTTCTRRLGLVGRRWLTVVDTPGWWCDFSSRDTTRLVKREILGSLSLCPPGPHVFLVTVKASSFLSERRRRALEEHVELLGQKVWSHCLLVFTLDHRGTRTQDLEESVFARLLDKCGGRRHSLHESGAAELLEKIQQLVHENGNKVFEMEGNILQEVEEEKRRIEEAAQLRFRRTKEHRSAMKEKSRAVTDMRIVLVGAKGSGKTSTMNTILGRAGEQGAARRTSECSAETGVVFGRQVTVVDTPGWWRNYFSHETSAFDRRELRLSSTFSPHVFLLVIRVDRAFSETNRTSIQEHLELIHEQIWCRVIVLFSFGDWLGATTPEKFIESEGAPLQWLVDRCANRFHVLNNRTRGDGFQVRELIGKIEELDADAFASRCCPRAVRQLQETKWMQAASAGERRARKRRQKSSSHFERTGEVTLVLVGGRNVGKSSCGNTILSRHAFTETTSCADRICRRSNGKLVVLDTPGCFKVTPDFLATAPRCVFLLVVNLSSSFTHEHLEDLVRQLGEGQWHRAVVVFSHGDWLGDTWVEQRLESEGEPLQTLVRRCQDRYHVLDNSDWTQGGQVVQLMALIEETLATEGHMSASVWRSHSTLQGSHRSCDGECVTSHDHQLVVPAERRLMVLDRSSLSRLLTFLSGLGRLSPVHLGRFFTSDLLTFSTQTPGRPALEGRQQTLGRSLPSADFQKDERGDSSLEDLEDFIDLYCEKILELKAETPAAPAAPAALAGPSPVELLLSIDRKLTQLEVLEDIRSDLSELRRNLELHWTLSEDLRDNS